LFIHSLTGALLLTSVMWWFHEATVWRFTFLLVTHYFIDRWKCRLKDAPFWTLYVDQSLHLLTILAVMMT
jgi:hypothetical protein